MIDIALNLQIKLERTDILTILNLEIPIMAYLFIYFVLLPTSFSFDTEKATAVVLHDKKTQDGGIYAIKTNEAGGWHGELILEKDIRYLFEIINEGTH